jgi:hypothetical protein
LKQFGFDTPGDPNQLDFAMQNVSTNFSPPMYGHHQQSDQQATQPLHFDQSQQRLPSSSSTTNFPSYHTQQQQILKKSNHGSLPHCFQQQQQQQFPVPMTSPVENYHDANTIFRYNPNNPFFGMPSSMNFSDIAWNQSDMFK